MIDIIKTMPKEIATYRFYLQTSCLIAYVQLLLLPSRFKKERKSNVFPQFQLTASFPVVD